MVGVEHEEIVREFSMNRLWLCSAQASMRARLRPDRSAVLVGQAVTRGALSRPKPVASRPKSKIIRFVTGEQRLASAIGGSRMQCESSNTPSRLMHRAATDRACADCCRRMRIARRADRLSDLPPGRAARARDDRRRNCAGRWRRIDTQRRCGSPRVLLERRQKAGRRVPCEVQFFDVFIGRSPGLGLVRARPGPPCCTRIAGDCSPA